MIPLKLLYDKVEAAIEQTTGWGELSYCMVDIEKGLIRAKWLKPNAYIYVHYSNSYSLVDTNYPGFSAESERLYQPNTRLAIKVVGLENVLDLIDRGFDSYLEGMITENV